MYIIKSDLGNSNPSCLPRSCLLLLTLIMHIAILGYSQKPKYVFSQGYYTVAPAITLPTDVKSYALQTGSDDPVVKDFIENPWTAREIKPERANFSSENPDLVIHINTDVFEIVSSKIITIEAQDQEDFFATEVEYRYPITISFELLDGTQLYEQQVHNVSTSQTDNNPSLEGTYSDFRSRESVYINKFKKKALYEATAMLKDKVQNKNLSNTELIFFPKSSKKFVFEGFEEVANDALSVFSGIKNQLPHQYKDRLRTSIEFWDNQLKTVDTTIVNNEWIIPICVYNLALTHLYLHQFDQSRKYLQIVKPPKYQGLNTLWNRMAMLEERIDEWEKLEPQPPVETPEEKVVVLTALQFQKILEEVRANMNRLQLESGIEKAKMLKNQLKQFPELSQFQFDVFYVLAQLYEQSGRYQEGYEQYLQLVEWINSGNVDNPILEKKILNSTGQLGLILGDYQRAFNFFNQSGQIYRNESDRAVDQLNLGKYYFFTDQYIEALNYFEQAQVMLTSLEGPETEILQESYDLLGRVHYSLGSYKEAKKYIQKGLETKIKALGNDHFAVSDSYILLANTYNKLAESKRRSMRVPETEIMNEDSVATRYLQKAKDLRVQLLSAKSPSILESEYILPDFFDINIRNFQLKYSSKILYIDDGVVNFGLNREFIFDEGLQEGIDYYDSIKNLTIKTLGIDHPSVAYYSNEMAKAYGHYYLISTSKWKKTRGVLGQLDRIRNYLDSPLTSLKTRAENFQEQMEYRNKAVELYDEALQVLQNSFGADHSQVGEQHLLIALFYQEVLRLYYEFCTYFLKDISIEEKQLSEPPKNNEHPKLYIENYDQMLKIYLDTYEEMIQFDQLRLQHFEKAYISMLHGFEANKFSIEDLLDSIRSQGVIHQIKAPEKFRQVLLAKGYYIKPYYDELSEDIIYDESGDVQELNQFRYGHRRREQTRLRNINNDFEKLRDLDSRLGTIEDYDKYIDLLLQTYLHDNDKFALARRTKYDRLAAVEKILGNRRRISVRKDTVRIEALNQAFYYIEKTRALVLLSSMAESGAQVQSELPEDLTDREKQLQEEIYSINRELAKEYTLEKQEQLLQTRAKFRDLKTVMATNYPNYNKSRFKIDIMTINDIQPLLDDQTAILSYTVTESSVIQFLITNRQIKYRTIDLGKTNVLKKVKALRNGILFKNNSIFTQYSNELSKILIPRLGKNVRRLVVIPDGELSSLPFEVLFSDKISKTDLGHYTNYPFLVRDYVISYAFSATLYFQNLNAPSPPGGGFLGFAPVFSDTQISGSMRSTNLETIKSIDALKSDHTRGILRNGRYINPIPSTEDEVNGLFELFQLDSEKAKIYTHERATENQLKTETLNTYRYLHFATHGFVNEEHPELSGLLFAQSDKNEDGILYSGEIYQLSLNADLVSLSACETGLGKFVSGEGVIGLSRAFTYAGARNLLVSFWKVADESTTELMTKFYANVIGNSNPSSDYGSALRKAKLNMIEEDRYAHPYYWSPFVLIGH